MRMRKKSTPRIAHQFYYNFKSRDIMDTLHWPLARMRSLHLYFGGWSDSNPQNGDRDNAQHYNGFLHENV